MPVLRLQQFTRLHPRVWSQQITIMERNIYGYDPQVEERTQTKAFPALMQKVYLWMAMALAITGLTAFYVAGNESLLYTIANSRGLLWGLMIAEVGLVMWLSAGINRMSFAMAGVMFGVYAILNGVTFSFILLAYTMESIATTFFVTAGTFGALSLFGLFTKRDLGAIGRFLFMALIGLIIATIVNMFVASTAFEWALTYIGLFIFCGLTAYDTQMMKRILAESESEGQTNLMKIALLCSLSLYLDFINMFLYLLRIFGDRRS